MKRIVRNADQLGDFLDLVLKKASWEKPLLVTVKTYRPPRTTQQNALLHVLFRQVANHVGRTDEEIKEIFKGQYGPTKRVVVGDLETLVPKGTSEYNKLELADMIEQIYAKGAEWGVEFQEVDVC